MITKGHNSVSLIKVQHLLHLIFSSKVYNTESNNIYRFTCLLKSIWAPQWCNEKTDKNKKTQDITQNELNVQTPNYHAHMCCHAIIIAW